MRFSGTLDNRTPLGVLNARSDHDARIKFARAFFCARGTGIRSLAEAAAAERQTLTKLLSRIRLEEV